MRATRPIESWHGNCAIGYRSHQTSSDLPRQQRTLNYGSQESIQVVTATV